MVHARVKGHLGKLMMAVVGFLLMHADLTQAETKTGPRGPIEILRGGMDSGGAGLYGSDHNPWFLENTPGITYCLDSDPAVFHQSLSVVDQMIKEAFDDWRTVFESSERAEPVEVPGFGTLRIATQKLNRVDCKDPEVDLRFQLGILSEEQKKQIGDDHQWIGAAYRTDYDEKSLRGKGFIYIAADAGPERPTSGELINNVWQFCDGCLLRRTLVHELGHVFGLGHVGNAGDIMSEGHLQKVTSVKWAIPNLSQSKGVSNFNTQSRLGSYLRTQNTFAVQDCEVLKQANGKWREIFGLKSDTRCLFAMSSAKMQGVSFGSGLELGDSSPMKFTRFLEMKCEKSGKNELGWLYLPPTQEVFFKQNPGMPGKFPLAFAYERSICVGRLKPVSRTSGTGAVGDAGVPMTLVFSRDGSIVGTAVDPKDPIGQIFTMSSY